MPAGTPLVLYACLPASLGELADRTVDAARRYAKEAHCEIVSEFLDSADPMKDREGCPGWHDSLAAVESGRAQGIITPLMVMLSRGKETHLAAWQRRTGAYLLTSSAIDTPDAYGLSALGSA
ncbi:hypothetical protein [Streptomyces sp. NPDC053367]|uniref:hypothetical protein n=1 Tax=Streptomyces sp. NPDC053367 TaxID=3365700 RepID=UPI0037D02480